MGQNEWHIPTERMKMRRPHIVPLGSLFEPLTEDSDDNGDFPEFQQRYYESTKLFCEVDVTGNIQEQINDIKRVALLQQKVLKEFGILGPDRRDKIKNYTPI